MIDDEENIINVTIKYPNMAKFLTFRICIKIRNVKILSRVQTLIALSSIPPTSLLFPMIKDLRKCSHELDLLTLSKKLLKAEN